jgi:hypothetical protein
MTSRIVLFWLGAFASVALAQSRGTFTATGNMKATREDNKAVILANNKIHHSGGYNQKTHTTKTKHKTPHTYNTKKISKKTKNKNTQKKQKQ